MARINGYPESVQAGLPKLAKAPDGWETAPLGKYLKEVRRPVKLEDAAQYRLVTVKRSRGGVVEREHLSGKDIKVKSQFRLSSGDFLISKRQIVHGACGIVPEDLDGAIVSNEYAVLHSSQAFYLPFLAYLAESAYFQQTCFHSSIGVHIEKMLFKLDRWLNWRFNIPPLLEQQRIVALLSTWDRAIAITERLIELNEKQKLALLQQLLSPSGGSFKKLKLKDMASVNQRSLDSTTPSTYSFRYISLSDVQDGRIASHLERHVFSSAPSRAQRKVASGDILMSTVRPNLLGFARVGDADADCIASTGFAVLTTKPEFDRDYLYHYLYSEHIIGQLNALVVGSNYPAINPSDVESLAVYCPPSDSQKKIGKILNNCDARRDGLHNQRRLLIAEKDALIQQLLTGRRRVKLTSEVAPTAAIG
jgi:type I restriction enzyme S subunit